MSGVSRFLSRREKHHDKHDKRHKHGRGGPKAQPVPPNLYTIFSNEELQLTELDEQKKVKMLLVRLQGAGINTLGEAQAHYALTQHPNDIDKAYDVLVLANDSFDGIVKDFDPDVKLLGAVNRNLVTCYLDALLFSMFARLDSFEAMLFDNFSDEPRKKLAATLRLWVNLLRTGRLIPVELTKHLQDALAKCGWEEAAEIRQQDASEAFTFITGALELPLLTLKMDIYHTGREDKEDDHKFVNERLLEVAIPEPEEDKIITLEDCLETYFNNRIEVKRYLQRQNTLGSVRSIERDPEKSQAIHIETVEVSASNSPIVGIPVVDTPISFNPSAPLSPVRPLSGRRRADSIFSERLKVDKAHENGSSFDEKKHLDEMWNGSSGGRPRSATSTSIKKEVLMPAWQFFSLIPWYTDNVPKTDAQVAAHFSAKRPVLGICLKRYIMELNGIAKRLNTYIDIPLEIGLPHFISDDQIKDEGPLFGNFKLVLQSVVCHRGVSVDSGHYVSLVRANASKPRRPKKSDSEKDDVADAWLRFDDLAAERVIDVDIKKALQEESPYLLFYQVQPIDEELANRGDPPSYTESQHGITTLSADPSKVTLASLVSNTTNTDNDATEWEQASNIEITQLDSGTSDERVGGRSSVSSNRRSSITFEEPDREELDSSVASLSRGRTAPTTPAEDKGGLLSTSRRGSLFFGSKARSRPTSPAGDNRLSITLSRLTGRSSKDKLQVTTTATDTTSDEPVIVVDAVKSEESEKQTIAGVNGGIGENAIPEGRLSTSPIKERMGDMSIGRSKSKREKGKDKKRDKARSKSRDPAEVVQSQHHRRPDRECIVM